MIETSDRGFLMVGETGFIESLSAKILVIKTDSTGELIWKKEFGKAGFNLGNALVENNNGNYIIAGSLDSSAALITVDAKTGDALPGWPKTYALHNESSFETVVIAENGDIIAGGYEKGIAEGTFYNEGVGVVVITDSTGVEKKSIDLSEYISTAYRIKASEDGYFIASHPVIETDTYDLIKIDKKGEFLFEKSYEGDLFWGFDRNEAGDMLLAGHTTDCPLSDNWDIIATSVDNTGLERWTTYTGQPRGYNSSKIHDEAWGARAGKDGSWYVIAGTGDEYSYEAEGHPMGRSGLWLTYLIKFSSKGVILWEGLYGDDTFETDWAGEDLTLTSDGGVLVAVDNGGFGFLKLMEK